MAGVSAMGELAHELESLIARIEVGLASADESARAVAQEALDELARMREAIASGRPRGRRSRADRTHPVGCGAVRGRRQRRPPRSSAGRAAGSRSSPRKPPQPAVEPEPPRRGTRRWNCRGCRKHRSPPAAIDAEHLIEIDHEALAAAPAAVEPSAVPMQPEVPARADAARAHAHGRRRNRWTPHW